MQDKVDFHWHTKLSYCDQSLDRFGNGVGGVEIFTQSKTHID